MSVKIYDKYTNIKTAASAADSPVETAHGLTPNQVNEMASRFENFLPNLASKHGNNSRIKSMFDDVLPKGANWSEQPASKTAQTFLGNPNAPGGGRTLVTTATPYQPEFASPDRQQYPVHRILANRYWRLFYKLDPVIGNCVDLFSDLPWSNFELTGDGIEGEVRQAYEYMCRETQVLAMLPYFVREFMICGEAIPHTFFDSSKGVFTHIAMHNPDQLEVIDAPFIKMEPIIEFIADDRLRSVLTSDQPSLRKIRDRMPPELMTKLFSKQNIPLSPVNATFIPRKLHPYDTRGTSIVSRLWRVMMYEDAVFNASIQTARRNSSPLKVAKLGNAATGWIPPPEQEKRLLELLAQAEVDPNAWLVYHYGIEFETVGTNERAMSINREWETIERIKLVALGVSKSFLHGEVSYASASTGLQIFLQRLKSLRMFFEQKWLYPKFFRPIAEINGWIKPKPAEVAHRFRVKRSAQELEEQNAYIIPKIVWDKTLDPQINQELVNAMGVLEGLGIKFSKTTKMAAVGFSFEEETKKIHREQEFEKTFLPSLPSLAPAEGAGSPGGMSGGTPPMPPPPGDEGKAPPGADGIVPPGVTPPAAPPPGPAGAGLEVGADKDDQSVSDKPKPGKSTDTNLRSEIWVDDKHGNWRADEISDLLDLIHTFDTDSAFWSQLGANDNSKKILMSQDMDAIWNLIDDYLQSQGYPDSDIVELKKILELEGVLVKSESVQRLTELENMLPDDAGELTDTQFADAVAKIIKQKEHKITADSSNFFTGTDSSSVGSLNGDISELLNNKRGR